MRDFPPRRIVCLTEETVETLYLLGEQDRIVGVSGYAVRPPQVRREKPRVSAFISADIPKILALAPDLVLAFSDLQADIVAELIRAGVAVHVFNQRDLAGILAMIRTLGAMVGATDRAEQLATDLARRLEAIAAMPRPAPRPKVYFEEWDDPLISGIGWVSELVEIACGADVLPHLRAQGGARAHRRAGRPARDHARRDPGVVVRQEGRARPHPQTTRLGRHPGCAQQSHRRDQVDDHFAAGTGGADGWTGRDRQGIAADKRVEWTKRSVPTITSTTAMVGTARPRICRPTLRDQRNHAFSTPHHSVMNSAMALVALRSDSSSTYSLKPCIAAPLAPKQRLGML